MSSYLSSLFFAMGLIKNKNNGKILLIDMFQNIFYIKKKGGKGDLSPVNMNEILDSGFELYKLKVQNFLLNPNPKDLTKLIEEIKAAAFLQEITDSEADFLIGKLPLEIDDSLDDEWEPEEISRHTGGINSKNIGKDTGIRRHEKDELDDFEEEEEEEESGFSDFASYQKKEYIPDELDDFDEEEEEEEESGFSSFGRKYEKEDNFDELDDFEEDDYEDESESSGFTGLI